VKTTYTASDLTTHHVQSMTKFKKPWTSDCCNWCKIVNIQLPATISI